jgi:hypothetical protein
MKLTSPLARQARGRRACQSARGQLKNRGEELPDEPPGPLGHLVEHLPDSLPALTRNEAQHALSVDLRAGHMADNTINPTFPSTPEARLKGRVVRTVGEQRRENWSR